MDFFYEMEILTSLQHSGIEGRGWNDGKYFFGNTDDKGD